MDIHSPLVVVLLTLILCLLVGIIILLFKLLTKLKTVVQLQTIRSMQYPTIPIHAHAPPGAEEPVPLLNQHSRFHNRATLDVERA